MANDQVHVAWTATGSTVYILIRDRDADIWNGSSFETYSTGNLGTYDVPTTEQGTASQHYAVAFPATIASGIYAVTAFEQAGGSPAEGDTLIGGSSVQWDGSEIIPLSSIDDRLPTALVSGKMDSDATAVSGSTDAADNLEAQSRTVETAVVVADGSNTATTFKTGLSSATDDYYNGAVLAWIDGTNNALTARRISDYNGTTNFVTVESAFASIPSTNDTFVVIGRIEV